MQTFIAITAFIFLAIVGALAGMVVEARRIPEGSRAHNPATQDTVFPIVGWASLFALYLALNFVAADEMTYGFKIQLGTLATLLIYYAVLATVWLIWRSVRRIHAAMTGRWPIVWRSIPFLRRLRFPILFIAAAAAAVTDFWINGASVSDMMLASGAVLLGLLWKPAA